MANPLKKLRNLTCALFDHEFELECVDSLHTTIYCPRCGASIAYEFEVEDNFFENEFPEVYGAGGKLPL